MSVMDAGHMNLINKRRADHRDAFPRDVARMDSAMDELIRRAQSQAGEWSQTTRGLDRSRWETRKNSNTSSGTDRRRGPHA